MFWLRDYHRAELFKDPAKLPETSLQELNIVANCLECHGTGNSGRGPLPVLRGPGNGVGDCVAEAESKT